MRAGILLLLLLSAGITSAQTLRKQFQLPYVNWKDADVLIWSEQPEAPFPPNEFCLALRRANGGIGAPTCRLAGDWQRDSALALYGSWLHKNLGQEPGPSFLRARSPAAVARLRGLVDQMLIYTTVRNDTLWAALFEGESAEPKSAGFVPLPLDPVNRANVLAQAWFTQPTERRLTAAERASAARVPDPFYAEKPSYDAWVGIAYGHTQAQIPLTPDSWYRSKKESRIKNYRNVSDSLSAWSFLEDASPLYSIYGGASFFGFLGLEFSMRYSQHKAKLDRNDAIYEELDHWDFARYEFALGCLLTRSYSLPYRLETRPHFFLSFLYSVLSEDIGLKSGYPGSGSYRTRVEFEEFYRGGLVGIGNRLVYDKRFALDLRTGFAARGRSLDREPNPDAVAEPTIIGGATFDGFVQVGIEYHWQWK